MPERKQRKPQANLLSYLLLFVVIAALGAGLLLKKDKVRKMQGVAVPVKQEGQTKKPQLVARAFIERETRLELATPTLARLCSTN